MEELKATLNTLREEAAKGTKTRAPGSTQEQPPAPPVPPVPPVPPAPPAPKPPESTLPSRRGPTEDELKETVTVKVIGQTINEDGVAYKKGETFRTTLGRALALGPAFIEDADED